MSKAFYCAQCGQPAAASELNADDECEVCAALMRLRATLGRVGRLRRDPPPVPPLPGAPERGAE